MEAGAERKIEVTTRALITDFSIDNVYGNRVSIRNTGAEPIDPSLLGVYVDDKPVDFTPIDEVIQPFSIGTIQIVNAEYPGPGKHSIRVSSAAVADTMVIPFHKSCKEIIDNWPASSDGIYTIMPGSESFDVYCDMTTDGGGWTQIEYLTTDSEGYKHGYASVFSDDVLGTFGSGSYKIAAGALFNLANEIRYSEPSTHITDPFVSSWQYDFKCTITADVRDKINNPGFKDQPPASVTCINLNTGATSTNAIYLNYQGWTGCWTGPRLWIGYEATSPYYHGDYCVDCVVTWKCGDERKGVYSTISASSGNTPNYGSGAFWVR
jgi:hypothetical protein